jgi:hypothetical protein
MPQVLNLDDGGMNLMMAYESNLAGSTTDPTVGPFRVWVQTSSDGGNTWGNSRVIFDAGNGADAGGPGLTQIPGFLVVSFMTNQDQPGPNDYPKLGHTDMKVIVSGDGGTTWSAPTKCIPQAGWDGVTAVEGGVMVLGATLANTVVMQKFTP